MADEPENLVLRNLREMRAEMKERFDKLEHGQQDLLQLVSGQIELTGVQTRRMTEFENRLRRIETRLELSNAPQEH